MNTGCARPIGWETLVDYWAEDLPLEQAELVEEQLLGCAACSASSARVAAIREAVRGMIPPLLTDAGLAELRARGLAIAQGSFAPGERRGVVFGKELDLLVHRLGGLALGDARRVRVTIRVEGSETVLFDDFDAPFERATNEVLLACQRHFAAFPPDIAIEVRVQGSDGTERSVHYAIPHQFEAR